MKRILRYTARLAILAGLVLTAGSLNAQTPVQITNLLFSEDFSGYTPGTLPTTVAQGGRWGSVGWGAGGGACEVVQDSANDFGQGTDNQFWRVTSTSNLNLTTPAFSLPQDAISFAFDYIGRYPAGDGSRWLHVQARAAGIVAHNTSIRNSTTQVRGLTPEPSLGGLNARIRVFTLFNNRNDTISYNRPDGLGTTNLSSTNATVWVYHYTGAKAETWEQLISEYQFNRGATTAGAVMDTLVFVLDGNAVARSFDIDDITILGSQGLLPPLYVALTNRLFFENFESYDPGTPPTTVAAGGKWGTATWQGTQGSWAVVEDQTNAFGFGTGNRFLQLSNTHNLNAGLITPVFEPQEALIYAFDFIGRTNEGDGNRWLNVDVRSASGAAHTLSPLMFNAQIRTSTGNVSYGGNDTPIRIVTVVNNRMGSIIYDRPDGSGTATLSATNTSVWLYHYSASQWEHLIPEYSFARTAGFPHGAVMDRVRFFLDSNAVYRSFDLDNVEVLNPLVSPPATPIVLSASVAGGNLQIRWQGKAGKSYQVRYRTGVNSGTWNDLGAAIVPVADGEQLATDSLSADTARFYRVQVSTPAP